VQKEMEKEKLSLAEIEKRLQDLAKQKTEIETAENLTTLLTMIEKLKLTNEVKKLLSETLQKEQHNHLQTLLNTPRDISRPMERPTRVENAKKKVNLFLSFIEKFIEKIEVLDTQKYKLYVGKNEYGKPGIVLWIGVVDGGYLWRKFSLNEIQEETPNIINELQDIKLKLETIKKIIDNVIDPNTEIREEQNIFDQKIKQVDKIEEKFISIYKDFSRSIIPNHIAQQIETEKFYKEDTITSKVQEYFNWMYTLENEDAIPAWVDTDTTRYIHMSKQKIPENIIAWPLHIPHIQYLPVQYLTAPCIWHENPEYAKAQELREKYTIT